MLTDTKKVIDASVVKIEAEKQADKQQSLVDSFAVSDSDFTDDMSITLTKAIGLLSPDHTRHYYSYGNFNLVRLILHIMKQTGPAHVFMTSYSFSQKSIEQLIRKREQSQLLSFKVIVDNRVKVMSPIPFQMLSTAFDYRCSSIHAKIALIWNEKWNITILTSQNATDNPKMERGTIYTDKKVFDFDLNAMKNEFNRGTT